MMRLFPTHRFRARSAAAILAGLACLAPASGRAAATVASFTGGDPGEGLDLQGNFAYAFNIGTPGAAGKVGDANFTADTTLGVTVEAQNEIGNWATMAMGTGDNDARLGFVLNSIRWSAAPNVVTLKLKVEKDIEYKLQLLFVEWCCTGRGFNIDINGTNEVQNFIPASIQAGDGDFTERRATTGAVVTYQFKSNSDLLTVVLDGPSADDAAINDRNAIINGLTLERISPVTDVDNDGLRDDWEQKYFGNLDATGTGDPDADEVSNTEEQTLGIDPGKADSDGDTLTDGAEVRTYKSDPLKKDTDGDGLDDGTEVNVYKTDPTDTDSDGDGTNDSQELSLGTDPADPASKPLLTTIGVVTGGDVGEGLDLEGTFPYALAIGGGDAALVTVRDAAFQYLIEADVAGATLVAGNTAGNWYPVVYGETENDLNLAAATSSIRWSDAANATTPEVVLTLENLELGAEYKLQAVFGEDCCNRGFDVFVDGTLVVKDFNPGIIQGGIGNRKRTALITRLHFARDTKIVLRFDGRGATSAFSDHNAILNAVTLERVAPKTDVDNDGLPDGWEKLYFGNTTAQAGTGDADGDGLSNTKEYEIGSDPTKADSDRDGLSDSAEVAAGTNAATADSDGDGLKDGEEINTYKTNPTKTDSDDDGLGDTAEVRTYLTDPAKADTDGDGTPDGKEVQFGSDPLKSEKRSEVSNVVVGPFSGGDPGEGLDLQGRFAYAVNVSTAGAAGKAGDADFTAETAPGVKITAVNNIAAWSAPEYGDSPADDVIEKVTQSIRYQPQWRVELSNLIPGSTYRLQLLFFEQCCAGRGFNIYVDGELVKEAFLPAEIQGGVANPAAGAMVSADIVSYRDKMIIIGDGPAGREAAPDLINDTNAILDGFTLEVLKEGTPVTPPALRITRGANGLTITFDGTLQASASVAGPYTDVPGTGSVTVTPTDARQFFRAVRK
jgi:hypothetical protein